jgi:hypothetical protein
MFPYFLLKNFLENKVETKYLDLYNYLKRAVFLEFTRTIKPQDPEFLVTEAINPNSAIEKKHLYLQSKS